MQNTLIQSIVSNAQHRAQKEAEAAAKLEADLPRVLRTHPQWDAFMEFVQDMHEGGDNDGSIVWLVHKLHIHGRRHLAAEVQDTFENYLEMMEDRAAQN